MATAKIIPIDVHRNLAQGLCPVCGCSIFLPEGHFRARGRRTGSAVRCTRCAWLGVRKRGGEALRYARDGEVHEPFE